jgi:hypothetical protein
MWALAFAAAGGASAEVLELAPAPYREEEQDTSAWIVRDLPKAARSRADVVALYQTAYVPGNSAVIALSRVGPTPQGCGP